MTITPLLTLEMVQRQHLPSMESEWAEKHTSGSAVAVGEWAEKHTSGSAVG